MKVGVWKRAAASMLAAALVFTGMDVSGLAVVQAEETNLFTDGDFGDDGSSFWSDDRTISRMQRGRRRIRLITTSGPQMERTAVWESILRQTAVSACMRRSTRLLREITS